MRDKKCNCVDKAVYNVLQKLSIMNFEKLNNLLDDFFYAVSEEDKDKIVKQLMVNNYDL